MQERRKIGTGVRSPLLFGTTVLGLVVVATLIEKFVYNDSDYSAEPVIGPESVSRFSTPSNDLFLTGGGAVRNGSRDPVLGNTRYDERLASDAIAASGEAFGAAPPEVRIQEPNTVRDGPLPESAGLTSNALSPIGLPPSDDPIEIRTLSELNRFHAQQMTEILERQQAEAMLVLPNSSDDVAIIGVAELSEMHRQQERESRNDDSGAMLQVPTFDGEDETAIVTVGELSQLLVSQTSEAKRFSSDPDSLVLLPESADPQHGLTIGELDRLHSEQSLSGR